MVFPMVFPMRPENRQRRVALGIFKKNTILVKIQVVICFPEEIGASVEVALLTKSSLFASTMTMTIPRPG